MREHIQAKILFFLFSCRNLKSDIYWTLLVYFENWNVIMYFMSKLISSKQTFPHLINPSILTFLLTAKKSTPKISQIFIKKLEHMCHLSFTLSRPIWSFLNTKYVGSICGRLVVYVVSIIIVLRHVFLYQDNFKTIEN